MAGERKASIERDVEVAYTFDKLHNFYIPKSYGIWQKRPVKKPLEDTQSLKESDDTFLFAQTMKK